MSDQTTVTMPAIKSKGYGRNAQTAVTINGTASGYGDTLAEAKASAVEALLDLATMQQERPAASVFNDGELRVLTVYYPQGSGTGSINIHVAGDGSMRVTCRGSMSGTPSDNAERATEQDGVTRI